MNSGDVTANNDISNLFNQFFTSYFEPKQDDDKSLVAHYQPTSRNKVIFVSFKF